MIARGLHHTHPKIGARTANEVVPRVLEKVAKAMVKKGNLVKRGETFANLPIRGEDPEDLVLLVLNLKAGFVAGPLRDEIMHHCAISF